MDALWPDADLEKGRQSYRTHCSYLRQALGPGLPGDDPRVGSARSAARDPGSARPAPPRPRRLDLTGAVGSRPPERRRRRVSPGVPLRRLVGPGARHPASTARRAWRTADNDSITATRYSFGITRRLLSMNRTTLTALAALALRSRLPRADLGARPERRQGQARRPPEPDSPGPDRPRDAEEHGLRRQRDPDRHDRRRRGADPQVDERPVPQGRRADHALDVRPQKPGGKPGGDSLRAVAGQLHAPRDLGSGVVELRTQQAQGRSDRRDLVDEQPRDRVRRVSVCAQQRHALGQGRPARQPGRFLGAPDGLREGRHPPAACPSR